jgi:hypothetical protein
MGNLFIRDYLYILAQLHNIENRLKSYFFMKKGAAAGTAAAPAVFLLQVAIFSR